MPRPGPNQTRAAGLSAQWTALPGNVHALARPENDRGLVADDLALPRMLLLLKRSPAQETELQRLLEDQQRPGSPLFHSWLTPDEFGRRFGPSQADLELTTAWLRAQGFNVARVGRGGTALEFSGTAGQVRNAFRTELHRYASSRGETVANASDPQIPTALAGVVGGFVSLHGFHSLPQHHLVTPGARLAASRALLPGGATTPDFTFNNQHGMGPGDFGVIYGFGATQEGQGSTIALVGRSNISIKDVRDFRAMFGLAANDPTVVVDGPDPGLVNGDETEAALDVQWSGAVAPKANIILVVAQSSVTTDGVSLSSFAIVDGNLAPLMSVSFGSCEAHEPAGAKQFYGSLYQQAAAQGITVMISSGDQGSAGCSAGTPPATTGLAVNALASTPYNVAVGGTDFDDSANASTYWSATNDAATGVSALSYIPEVAWNLSPCAPLYPTSPCGTLVLDDAVAGGGGFSALWPKPAWQVGVSPADNARDMPDVSLFSLGTSFYIICESDLNPNKHACSLAAPFGNFSGIGGTSASSPAFAGILARIAQTRGTGPLGNVNPALYKLAATKTVCNSSIAGAGCVFYDTTKGDIDMPCKPGSPDCGPAGPDGVGLLVDKTGARAWKAVAGYDLATGLGSVNVANLAAAWTASGTATTTTLATSSGATIAHGATAHFTIGVAGGGGTPSGDASIVSAQPGVGIGPIALSGGAATVATTLLPGGTYALLARYLGDTQFGGSDSSPLSLTVTPETSKLVASFVTQNFSDGSVSSYAAPTTPYGSPYVLRMRVANANGDLCSVENASGQDAVVPAFSCATGSVTVSEGGVPVDKGTFPLGSRGYSDDLFIQLAGGTHQLALTYAGDPSFGASTNTTSLVVTPAVTTAVLTSSSASVNGGDSVTMTVVVSSQSNGAKPTGTVQFFGGTTLLGGSINYASTDGSMCQPSGGCASFRATAQVPIQTAGLLVPPAQPGSPWERALPFPITALAAAIFLRRPRKWRNGGGLLLCALFAVSQTSCGNSHKSGPLSVTAKYSGDANYATVTTPPVTIQVH